MKIPLCKPYIDPQEIIAVMEVLDSGVLTHGNCNKKFEEMFSNYIGVKYSVSLNSCASALQIALQANKIKGDVIIPSFTFSATANAVITGGANPVFCDINYDTCNMDVSHASSLVNSRTEAIIPVHFAGQPCEMDKIKEIADRNHLCLIEDSAETLGATFDGKQAGSYGNGCFSFFPTKLITTGEGGMFCTDDKSISDKVKLLSSHGVIKRFNSWERDCVIPSYNYRMSNINASIGCVQMDKLKKIIKIRRDIALFYDKYLNREFFDLPFTHPKATHVYQMYTVKLKNNLDRNEFINRMRKEDIEISAHFCPPVHKQSFYRSNQRLLITEIVSSSIVTFPIYPFLTNDEVNQVVNNANRIAKELI